MFSPRGHLQLIQSKLFALPTKGKGYQREQRLHCWVDVSRKARSAHPSINSSVSESQKRPRRYSNRKPQCSYETLLLNTFFSCHIEIISHKFLKVYAYISMLTYLIRLLVHREREAVVSLGSPMQCSLFVSHHR